MMGEISTDNMGDWSGGPRDKETATSQEGCWRGRNGNTNMKKLKKITKIMVIIGQKGNKQMLKVYLVYLTSSELLLSCLPP